MIYQVANILLLKITFKTSMLRSDFCDYSDAYIVVKGRITANEDNDDQARNKKLIFKNNAPIRSRTSKMNNTFVDNVEDLDNVMAIYNLLEYSENNTIISEVWLNYYGDEIDYDVNENNNANNKINNYNNNILDTGAVVQLKYLSKFWRFLDSPLINCEKPVDAIQTVGAYKYISNISNAKSYVPVVTLSLI